MAAQPDKEHVRARLDEVAPMLQRSHPKVAGMLGDAEEDLPLAAYGQKQMAIDRPARVYGVSAETLAANLVREPARAGQ